MKRTCLRRRPNGMFFPSSISLMHSHHPRRDGERGQQWVFLPLPPPIPLLKKGIGMCMRIFISTSSPSLSLVYTTPPLVTQIFPSWSHASLFIQQDHPSIHPSIYSPTCLKAIKANERTRNSSIYPSIHHLKHHHHHHHQPALDTHLLSGEPGERDPLMNMAPFPFPFLLPRECECERDCSLTSKVRYSCFNLT